MIDSIINCKSIGKADAIILSAPYGRSFTFRGGAEKGPVEIVKCLHSNLEFFDRFTKNEPVHKIKIGHHELISLKKAEPEKMIKEIGKFYEAHKEQFILMLGGDHSVSIGAFYALAKYLNPKEITILQIDAHPDLRDNTFDYKETSNPIDHACVMRRAYEKGYKMTQVGIRTYSIYEYAFILKHKLKVFEWGRGKNPSINSIIKSIKTDKVYLTFDIDGLDPAHAPATGTPVPGGLEWGFARQLLRSLILTKNLVGADIVEVSPIKNGVLTQYAAAQLCYDIISHKLLKDKGVLKFYN